MSEADTMRGEEVQIGKFKFTMPNEPPVTDNEVIEREYASEDVYKIKQHA